MYSLITNAPMTSIEFSTHRLDPFTTNWKFATLGMDEGEDGEWCNEPMETGEQVI